MQSISSMQTSFQSEIAPTPLQQQQLNPKYYTSFSLKIGLTQFRSPPIINNRTLTYLNHTIVKKLSHPNLTINSYYFYWRWQQLFRSISKMNHTLVQITEYDHKNVLRDICGIWFHNVKVMKLNVDKTISIEAIAWLNCDNLEQIELIVKVRNYNVTKPFVKRLFPRLRIVTIQCEGTDEIEFGRVALADVQQSSVFSISIQSSNESIQKKKDGRCLVRDFSFLSKVGSKQKQLFNNQANDNQHSQDSKSQSTDQTSSQSPSSSLSSNYNKTKIYSSMKTRLLKKYHLNKSYHHNNSQSSSKTQGEKVIECLFERKFQIGVVNENNDHHHDHDVVGLIIRREQILVVVNNNNEQQANQ